MSIGRSLHKQPGNAYTTSGFSHASFQHIADTEFSTHLPYVDGVPPVSEAGATNDEQGLEPRQCGNDFFGHAIGEILLLGVAAHVLEREHGDRRLVGQRRWALSPNNTRGSRLSRFTRHACLIGPDWLLNVLHMLNTKVHE